MNLDRAGRQLDDLAIARQIIGALALDLDGGIAWRGLFYGASELRQQRADGVRRRPEVAGLDDLALGVVGVALLAPAHREAVALAAVHHEGEGLSGFPGGNRQAPWGGGVGRAAITG